MARQATSPEEIAQIARVRSLLSDVMLAPLDVVVTRTNNKKIKGQLVRDLVVNRPGKEGARVCYGVVTLATNDGKVEIDYLDIVWIEGASKPLPPPPVQKRMRRRSSA
jgi:hypothetical protein